MKASQLKSEEGERAEVMAAMSERGYDAHAQQTLRRVATWVMRGALVFSIALFFVPDPIHILTWTAVVLPWLAIAAVAKLSPFYRLGGPRNSAFPDLSPILIFSGLLLAFRVLTSLSTVDWHSTMALTLMVGGVFFGAALYADPWLRKHLGAAILYFLFCIAYGYGAGLQANALLDHSSATEYPVVVQSKRVSHGKSTTYYLRVPAWGPRASAEDVTVSRWRYQNTGIGDTVCMLLRPGALGVGWYVVASCQIPPGH